MPEVLGKAWAAGRPGGRSEVEEAREEDWRGGGRAVLGEAWGGVRGWGKVAHAEAAGRGSGRAALGEARGGVWVGEGRSSGGSQAGRQRLLLSPVTDTAIRETNSSIGSNLKNLMRFWVIHLTHWALF